MTVKHKSIHHHLHTEGSDDDFIVEMTNALNNVIDTAMQMGTTVDWGTLTVEPTDEIQTYTADGARQSYSLGVYLKVDSISIEEDE